MDGHLVIVGGGAIGSAIAYFALSDPAFRGRVSVIERDSSYARASSALSASSIRQQFSTPINIALSRFGFAFLRDAAKLLEVEGDRPDIALHESSYLYLASPAGREVLARNHALQRTHAVDVEWLEQSQLAQRFDWLACDDLACGALGRSGEGWFDGYALLQALRRKARLLGARYIESEVCGMEQDACRVVAVTLADGARIEGDAFVNAAGPWAARVARWLGIDLPVRARKRSVFVFTCPTAIARCPLVIDPCGLWFRPEGSHRFICGTSPTVDDDPDEPPLDVDHRLFDEVLWPALARRVPAFEAIRATGAWAGYYEYNTFDQNGIVGAHPHFQNLYFANGFSGHGLQHAPGVGRGIAELIVRGGYHSLDLSPLGLERIAAGKPLIEANVI
ncbi:MAG TPA: FAD-binding oxidoreductase [Casimicrobiaceae bacterium]|nr:FAD-binding oxidoreductase [Casimicrobiaceae bacterium]